MIAKKYIFSTSEPAYAVDRTGQIVAWNTAAEDAFGFTEREALSTKCWELLAGRDVFGNPSCCEGCPIRSAAFAKKPINRFQVDFETADNEPKRFTVSTLVLFDGPNQEMLIHLCRPDSAANDGRVMDSQSRARPRPARNALTRREIEVLDHLSNGTNIKDIAVAMSISPSTVRNHIQHVLQKLRAHSRLEAVSVGRKLGLI
jgi:DNA-binding CsgD family transcriptional regulator